ncbi:hypothetical protein N9N16_04715 [Porticoccaceae bacterium]|nr:hypothetical protein [Porticoccaceae bacterium]
MRKSESKLPEELEGAKETFLDAIYGEQSQLINSEIADQPEFTANIEKRLKDVGNHCHGNVTRALQKDASISESTKRLADSLAAKLMAI